MTLSHYLRFDPWPGTMRCVLGQSTLLTQIVYPHRCINKKLKSWKKPCDGLASHLPHVTEIGISSRPAWWLTGSCANFYIHTWPSKTNPSDWTRNCQEWATVLDGFLSDPFFIIIYIHVMALFSPTFRSHLFVLNIYQALVNVASQLQLCTWCVWCPVK